METNEQSPAALYAEALAKYKSGWAKIKVGKNDEADKDFKETLRLLDEDRTPAHADNACWYYNTRGLANLMLKNFEAAKNDLIKAIHSKNDVAVFYYTLSLANLELGHTSEAIEYINAGIKMLESGRNRKANEKQHPADYYHARGVIYKLSGDYEAAFDDLLKADKMKKQQEAGVAAKERMPH